jgi:predicted nucleic acid-binding protein
MTKEMARSTRPQGMREDAQYRKTFRLLEFFPRVALHFSDPSEAASIDRHLRTRGLTMRSPIECLMAALALRGRFLLLHKDRDYPTIARFSPLKLSEESQSEAAVPPRPGAPSPVLPFPGSPVGTRHPWHPAN